jgi:hypothetical protein
VLAAGIAWYLAPLEPGILALQFAFTPRAFAEVVHLWPPEHLERYRNHLPFAYLLMVAYGALGYLLSSHWAILATRTARWWLPLAALFEGVEKGLHWWLTAAPRFGVPVVYGLSASLATLKWLLIFGFALLALYALARAED